MKKRGLQLINNSDKDQIRHLSKNLIEVSQEEAAENRDLLLEYLESYDLCSDSELYILVMFSLGEYYGRNGDYAQAQKIFETALAYAKKHKNKNSQIRAMSNLAITKAQSGFFPEAMEVWQDLLLEDIDEQMKLNLINNVSVACGITGQYNKGIGLCFQALEIADELGAEKEKVEPLINLGDHYNAMNLHEKALKVWLEAKVLAEKHGKIRRAYDCCNDISLAYAALKEYEKALDYSQRSLISKLKYASEAEIAQSYNNIGVVHRDFGNPDEAMLFFKQALRMFEHCNEKQSVANCQVNLAELHFWNHEYDLALQYLLEAEDVVKSSDMSFLQNRCCKLFVDVYTALGQYEEALKHSVRMNELLTKNLDDNNKGTVPITEAEYYRKKIENQAKQYQEQNIELLGKNKIIRQKTRELTHSNKALVEANDLLNRMISIVSHDVRAPLANIIQAMSMINEGLLSPQEQSEIFQELQTEITELFSMISEILEWMGGSGHKAKNQTVRSEQDLVEVIKNISRLYRHIAKQKQIELSLQSSAKSISTLIDIDLLKIVMRNLLNNALKYTPNGGKVNISLALEGETIRILVIDNGIGMSAAQIKKILSGKAVSKNNGDRESGFGLGFRFCLNSVKRMKGELKINSALGKGSTIEVLLPL